MSVRVADRNLSRVQYIHNAQQIVYLVEERMTKYANKIANEKRYKDFMKYSQQQIWNSPIYHAKQIYQFCQLANMKRDSIKRLAYLDQANENLTLLKTSVQTFYDRFRPIVKDKFLMLLADKIELQKKLIDGYKKYVKNVG